MLLVNAANGASCILLVMTFKRRRERAAMPANIAMPMFLTGCQDRNAHMEIWLRVNCFDFCKSSFLTCMNLKKNFKKLRVMS